MIKIKTFFKILIICFLLLSCVRMEAQTLTNYAKQRQKEIAEIQRIEKINYQKACNKGTIKAYEEYLKLYPKGLFVKEVTNFISDFDLWNKAISINTIAAYNDYLKNSTHKCFKNKAECEIKELISAEEWSKVKNTDTINDLEQFKKRYPNSSYFLQADKKIHELKAVKLYFAGQFNEAYSEFIKAGGRFFLNEANIELYNNCKENDDFSKLNSYSNEADLQAFLKSYPNSSNYNNVSNLLAISKAKSLTVFSGISSFESALYYAKDDATKSIVKSYIKSRNNSYKAYKRQQRKSIIMANGGDLMFGLEVMDLGLNFISPDRDLDVYYYNIGASLRFGNYRSPIQLELGIKPGMICYNHRENSRNNNDRYWGSEKFHMPIYSKLKINLCDYNSTSKLYICGLVSYNAIRDELLENDYSVGGGVGIAWRHWDWLALYYRQDLNNLKKIDDKFLGSSFVYYF